MADFGDDLDSARQGLEGLRQALGDSDFYKLGWGKAKEAVRAGASAIAGLPSDLATLPSDIASQVADVYVQHYNRSRGLPAGTHPTVESPFGYANIRSALAGGAEETPTEAGTAFATNLLPIGSALKTAGAALSPLALMALRGGREAEGLNLFGTPSAQAGALFGPARKYQTVNNAQRLAFPGTYKDPRAIADEANALLAPESPNLKRLFGVTRPELADTASRSGNLTDPRSFLPGAPATPRGSEAGQNVTTQRNANRIQNVLSEVQQRAPGLWTGMKGWYVMDPAYQRLAQLWGPEEGLRRYARLNAAMGFMSPGSDVMTEINRGTGANWLAQQGRLGDFMRLAGMKEGARGADFPEDMRAILSHPYHTTAQAPAFGKFAESGAVQAKSPKVPAYIAASGVPQGGFQTSTPVGDAHFARALGLPDVRNAPSLQDLMAMSDKERVNAMNSMRASVSMPELMTVAPWWQKKVAGPMGLESVPAQAITWGAFGPQTGVDTAIGAPKLELLADQIMHTASRLGVSPETARDMVLSGEAFAGGYKPKTITSGKIANPLQSEIQFGERDVNPLVGKAQTPVEPAGAGTQELRQSGGVRGGAGLLAQPYSPAPGRNLEGLPEKLKSGEEIHSHQPLQELANDYAKNHGIAYSPPTKYADAPPERGAKIAKAFEEMPDISKGEGTPEYRKQVLSAYQKMADETMAQYKHLKDAGYKFEFFPAGEDPYKGNPINAIKDLRNNKHMYVYSTEEGFGETPISDKDRASNPLLKYSGESWNGHPVTINDIFRATHDAFGHAKEGNTFRAAGEENAWRAHRAMYSPEAAKAMTSETRGQNSYVNFGPHGAFNRGASGAETKYAPQKVGILPDWVHEAD